MVLLVCHGMPIDTLCHIDNALVRFEIECESVSMFHELNVLPPDGVTSHNMQPSILMHVILHNRFMRSIVQSDVTRLTPTARRIPY